MSNLKNISNSPLHSEATFIAKAAGEEMLARLSWMKLQPKVILDAGCGTSFFSAKLSELYPDAQIIALDLSFTNFATDENQNSKIIHLNGDCEKLPLQTASVDFIFANFLFPWVENQKLMLNEWQRVLRPEGLLMFTALGPDTLKEWREKSNIKIIPCCIDMHDIGDVLLQQGFADPVLDVEYLTVNYSDANRLLSEMQLSEMLQLQSAIEKIPLDLTFEIIYAHAFGPVAIKSNNGEVRVPLSVLKR